jgi:hypothetical protein
MSHQEQEPIFYSLEFDSDVTFWTQGDASTRHVFLMPLRTPTEFLAFGVLAPSSQVLFVARGQVEAHLADFLARMKQAEARVELYARPPLPGDILRKYGNGDPIEQQEGEPPPPPPGGPGLVSNEPTSAFSLRDLSGEALLWPEDGASTRQALFVLLPGSAEFIAFGVFQPARDARYRFRTPFVARGSVREHLGSFIARVLREGARVEFHARPPLRPLEEYLARHFPAAWAQSSGGASHNVHA